MMRKNFRARTPAAGARAGALRPAGAGPGRYAASHPANSFIVARLSGKSYAL